MSNERAKISQIKIAGFKSIGKEENLSFGDKTIVIGANGSGKSNLVSFFRLLHEASRGNLQELVAKQGGANNVLYYGSKVTKKITSEFLLKKNDSNHSYIFELMSSNDDKLFLRLKNL